MMIVSGRSRTSSMALNIAMVGGLAHQGTAQQQHGTAQHSRAQSERKRERGRERERERERGGGRGCVPSNNMQANVFKTPACVYWNLHNFILIYLKRCP